MAYDTRGAKGHLRETLADLDDNGQLGDWCFFSAKDKPDRNYIMIRCPDGNANSRGSVTAWRLRAVPDPNDDDWQWDGNRDAPTLTPSLHWVGVWHGWMRAGELVSA